MFKVDQYVDHGMLIYELIDTEANSSVKVAPERGGIIIGFTVEGKDLLYLNPETFYGREANVRGGIPILFPISGQLGKGQYRLGEKTYFMKNHGFARNLPWEVVRLEITDSASISISLKSNDETIESYPFELELLFKYQLVGTKLTIFQEYRNQSDQDMPISAGFHPYFNTAHKQLVYDVNATEYLDYNDMATKPFTNMLDLTDKLESFIITDPKDDQISFELPELQRKITMSYAPEFKYIVLWTEAGKEFVCVEPWMAQNNAFNEGEGDLIHVNAHSSLHTWVSISS